MQNRQCETNMVVDSIVVDFVLLEKQGFKFYQMETPIAIAPYFPRFYIDENNIPTPISEGLYPLIPDTAIIIIN